jgi:hypothetical protein
MRGACHGCERSSVAVSLESRGLGRGKDPEDHLFPTKAVNDVEDIQNISDPTYTATNYVPKPTSFVSCCGPTHQPQCSLSPTHSASFARSATVEGFSLITQD